MSTEEKVLSEATEQLLDKISNLSVGELVELTDAIKDKFGVEAVAPVAAVAAAPGDAGAGAEPAEKTDFDIVITDAGATRVKVILAVKKLLEMDLPSAKAALGNIPAVIKEGVKKATAEEIKAELEKHGAVVELR